MPAFANDASDKFSRIIARELLKVDSSSLGKFARPLIGCATTRARAVRLSTYSKKGWFGCEDGCEGSVLAGAKFNLFADFTS
jgi:hypothetical protein